MSQPSKSKGYQKEMGYWTVVFLATGAILGPAIGFTPVSVVALAGPSGILSWVIAFILMFVVSMAYAELGTMWPRAGGVAYYPAKSSGPVVGVMNAWGSLVGYALAVPSIVVAFVEYFSYWFPGLYQNGSLTIGGIAASLACLLLIFYINTLRIRYMAQLNNVLTIITIAGLAILIITLLTHFHGSNFSAFKGFMPAGFSGLFLAISATIYGYGGFRQPLDYAEEVKDPGATMPKAIAMTMVITMIVYFLESFSFIGAIDWHSMGVAIGNWSGLNSLPYPFVSVLGAYALPAVGLMAMVTILIASFKDGYIYFGGASRVGYTLARYDRYLPATFTRMTENGIPLPSVLLTLIVSAVYIILLPAFSSLFPLVAAALLLSYAPGPLSLAIFRVRYPDEKRPYVLPMVQILAPIAFVVSSLMVYWAGWPAVRILIPSTFVGLLLLFFYNNHQKLTAQDWSKGIWFPIYQIAILIMSYLGSSTFGGSNAIPAPWDSTVFVLVALAFYVWGYRSGVAYKGTAVFDDPVHPHEMPLGQEG